jgi:hypothetical protein
VPHALRVSVLSPTQIDLEKFGARLAVTTTIIAFVGVNIVTLHVFLFRPFTWGDGTVARFMY